MGITDIKVTARTQDIRPCAKRGRGRHRALHALDSCTVDHGCVALDQTLTLQQDLIDILPGQYVIHRANVSGFPFYDRPHGAGVGGMSGVQHVDEETWLRMLRESPPDAMLCTQIYLLNPEEDAAFEAAQKSQEGVQDPGARDGLQGAPLETAELVGDVPPSTPIRTRRFFKNLIEATRNKSNMTVIP